MIEEQIRREFNRWADSGRWRALKSVTGKQHASLLS
jgi:hypothetical protein